MPKDTIDPIRKSITVPLAPNDAFRLFTDGFGTWWPLSSHSISAANGALPKSVTVEPRKGGSITETTDAGTKEVWGRVTEWKPGVRLDIDWHVGRDASEATQVSVVFTPEDGGTRVELTHDGFDQFGDAATAQHGRYQSGWDVVLAAFTRKSVLIRGKITT